MKPPLGWLLAFAFGAVIGSAAVQKDLPYGEAGGERLLLDASVPDGAGPFPIAILVHGGGWGSGDKSGSDKPGSTSDVSPWFEPLTTAKFTWFSINYRLAPKHRWPACLEDVQTAIRWVKAHAAEFKGDANRIALFGHSAGGHLVCLAATNAAPDTRVQAVVGFAPVTDHEQDLPQRGGLSTALQNLLDRPKEVTPESRALLRELSPINHVKSGLPPFLLVHGEADKSVPFQQSLNFQARLRVSGVPCEILPIKNAPHSIVAWEKIDTGYKATMVAWLRRTLDVAGVAASLRPDFVVAADGSGDCRTVQEAVGRIPRDNRERQIVFIKDGVYREKIRLDAACVTLRGQSRSGTRIEFAQGAGEFRAKPDNLGTAVVNLNADDCVLENLTIENTHGVIGTHAFAVFGRTCDRTVIVDCDLFSQGNDTLSLWDGARGRYYHARLKVRGSVDFICPRGWCYLADSQIHEVNPKAEAAMWHDGSKNRDQKFVLRNCRFDGVEGWGFARHHHDAQFYFLDSTFSAAMRDRAPYRVIYPLNGGTPTAADIARNQELDATNVWGERSYFFNCRRDGGDYAWHADNLATAPGAPTPAQITAAWTFAGTWNPERRDGPRITRVERRGAEVAVTFDEPVTVKGRPRLALRSGAHAGYAAGSGGDTLQFTLPVGAAWAVAALEFNEGAIVASAAAATLRIATTDLP